MPSDTIAAIENLTEFIWEKAMRALVILITFLSLTSSALAEGLLAGNYNCRIAGASTISDGRGSSVRYQSGSLTIDESDNVSLSSRAIFTVKNRQPKTETLTVSGSGKLKNYLENDGDASASMSFSIKPAKKVVYKGNNLTGKVTGTLELVSGAIISVKTVTAKISTPIGTFGLVCASYS